MGLEQLPQWLEAFVQPPGLRAVSRHCSLRQRRRRVRQQAAHDAVPAVGAAKQGLGTTPVAAIADREIRRRLRPQAVELCSDIAVLGQGHLHRLDRVDLRQAKQQRVAEAEMGGRRIVVDRQRQIRGAGHGGIVLIGLFLGKRNIGNGREQQAVSAGLCRIPSQRPSLVRTKRADPDHEGNAARHAFHRRDNRPAAFLARQIHKGAGAAEQADRLGPGVSDAVERALQGARVHAPRLVGGRQWKGGKAGEQRQGFSHRAAAPGTGGTPPLCVISAVSQAAVLP
jgi:hypothetical protein